VESASQNCYKPPSFYRRLIGNYTDAADQLLSVLTDFKRRQEERLASYDLFGGLPETALRGANRFGGERLIPPCPNVRAMGIEHKLAMPDDLERLFPKEFLIGHDLGLGRIEVCYSQLLWDQPRVTADHRLSVRNIVGYSSIGSPRGIGTDPFSVVANFSHFGRVAVVVAGSFSGEPVFQRKIVGDREIHHAKRMQTWEVRLRKPLLPNPANPRAPLPDIEPDDIEYLKLQIDHLEKYGSKVPGLFARTLPEVLPEEWNRKGGMKDRLAEAALPVPEDEKRASELLAKRAEEIVAKFKGAATAFDMEMSAKLLGLSKEPSTELASALDRLDGARVLLESFLRLGFSRALNRNSALRALLDGSERLVDKDWLQGSLAGKRIGPSELLRRPEILHGPAHRLSCVLYELGEERRGTSFHPIIQDTLRRLRSARQRIAHATVG